MKKGEKKTYKEFILNKELEASVGHKSFNKIKNLKSFVDKDTVSVGDMIKKIEKIKSS